jgi:hypothetical protein
MRCPLPNSSVERDLPPAYHGGSRTGAGAIEKRGLGLTCLLLALTAASSAGAQVPAIEGTYRAEGGCRAARTDDLEEFDATLTSQAVTTFASRCTFKGSPKRIVGGFRTEALCDEEGEEDQHTAMIDILRNGDVYTVRFADGLEWGPFEKCH